MRRLSRDSWLAIGLFVTLALVTIIAAIYQTRGEEEAPSLASFSSAPDGARALQLWLEALGYSVSDEVGETFRLPQNTAMVLMLEPFAGITADEWETIDAWVESGGTLVLAGDRFQTTFAARHYDFNLAYLEEIPTPTVQTPLLTSPPLTGTVDARAQAYFVTDRDDFVTHLAVESGPVMLSFELGAGRVILSAAPFSFSNAGLKEEGNPQLMLNVVTAARQSGVIWFDEWHHGVRPARATLIGPGDWLRYTPAGRSLLYAAAVVFLALVMRGRHFGRPIPLPRDVTRRAPLEYITAVANLSRRAGHRSAALLHYHHQIKRNLGKRYRLNPTLPDGDYVAQLAELNPNLDADALRSLLRRLRQDEVSESRMVQLATEVAEWLKES
jgi:hypothetical protein